MGLTNKKIISIVESLGHNIKDTDIGFEVEMFLPNEGTYTFYIDPKDVLGSLMTCIDEFDEDEYVLMWATSKTHHIGVRALLEDATSIQDDLNKLYELFRDEENKRKK